MQSKLACWHHCTRPNQRTNSQTFLHHQSRSKLATNSEREEIICLQPAHASGYRLLGWVVGGDDATQEPRKTGGVVTEIMVFRPSALCCYSPLSFARSFSLVRALHSPPLRQFSISFNHSFTNAAGALPIPTTEKNANFPCTNTESFAFNTPTQGHGKIGGARESAAGRWFSRAPRCTRDALHTIPWVNGIANHCCCLRCVGWWLSRFLPSALSRVSFAWSRSLATMLLWKSRGRSEYRAVISYIVSSFRNKNGPCEYAFCFISLLETIFIQHRFIFSSLVVSKKGKIY